MARRNWTREETILAMDLYTRVPFSKIGTREWFAFYNRKKIILPDKFLPGREFIEYHNDTIFKGA